MTTVTSVSGVAGAVTVPIAVTGSVADLSELLDAERRAGRRVGMVPTMGALHGGHVSLITRAVAECDMVVVSVFVNPTQFAEPADLANYPRTLEADLDLAVRAGADLVFAPSVTEMYPDWPTPSATTVTVRPLGDRWEGRSRPGHFDGVATVVGKLLSIAGHCRTYFGEKDFQQLAIVRRMAQDLSLPVEVIGCPTVREADGLALSSRNVRLAPEERAAAGCLSRSLVVGAETFRSGGDRSAVEGAMVAVFDAEPLVDLDYAVLVDADDLEPAGATTVGQEGGSQEGGRQAGDGQPLRLLVAAQVGPVRLIDNCDPRAPW